MTQKLCRNTHNTLLLLLMLWSGVAVAMEFTDLHRSRENRKESRQLQDMEDACSYTCSGNNFGIETGKCSGNMTLNCVRRLYPYKGVEMNTSVVLTCLGKFENISTRSSDGIQTHLKCVDSTYMKATVHTEIPKDKKQNTFIFEYNCSGSFSSVMNDDRHIEGSAGSESFQNSVCNGTEIVKLRYSTKGGRLMSGRGSRTGAVAVDDLVSAISTTGGKFLRVDLGSCSTSGRLLNSIDILGVFYSYMIFPSCEAKMSKTTDLFTAQPVPTTLSCNGATQEFNQECNGLLLSMTQVGRDLVTCKCSGHWKESWSKEHAKKKYKYTCVGNLSGEQVRLGEDMRYVRSSFCGGENTFVPLYWEDDEGKPWSGSWNNCTETSVRSTIFSPLSS